MKIYIALLRGINVGGKNIIKMADLKRMFEELGFLEVKTYIQSGNVLFKSDEEEENLRSIIEEGIEKTFGISVNVILRTAEELGRILENCPFSKEDILRAESVSIGESLYVSLMLAAPSQEKIRILDNYQDESTMYSFKGRDIYLLFRNGISNSKLANNLHRLEVPTTVRNWKTLNKIFEIAKSMEV